LEALVKVENVGVIIMQPSFRDIHDLETLATIFQIGFTPESLVNKVQKSAQFYLYLDSFNSFKPKFEKVSALHAQLSFYSGSFWMLPTYFRAASIFLARFGPQFLGKTIADDLQGVGKSSDILNIIYQ